MNKVYRIVWSRALNARVVVSELSSTAGNTSAHHDGGGQRAVRRPGLRTMVAACAFALLFPFASVANAAGAVTITNAGFETGNLTGWSLGPDSGTQASSAYNSNTGVGVSVVTGMSNFTPGGSTYHWNVNPFGTYMASLQATNSQTSSNSFTATATALGLSAANQSAIASELAASGNGAPTNASYMSQTLTLNAGDSFTMAWQYVSTDYTPFNDASITTLINTSSPSALATINNSASQYALLGATNPGTGSYSTGSYGATGWEIATYTVTAAGTYQLGFASFNLSDTTNSPVLFVDQAPGTTFNGTTPVGPVAPNPTDIVTTSNAAGLTGSSATLLPVFDGGTLVLDGTDLTPYSFTITGNNGTIDLNGQSVTISNPIADATSGTPGGLTVSNSDSGGTLTLSGVNSYTGATAITSGASLALTDTGSIVSSSGVTDNGTFDISGASGNESITTLSGNGGVNLGANDLVLTHASGNFAGTIGGTGGLALAGGTEVLSGASTDTGTTSIDAGATLALIGAGSIQASAGVTDNGTFDISGATGNESIATLDGNGSVNLGVNGLALTHASGNFAGTIGGTGGFTLAGGTEVLSGASTNTGATSIDAGATLALTGAGSIPAAAAVTDNGTFDISGASGNESITTLSGNGGVNLGANDLVLTHASGNFAGTIGGTGGLTLAGGTEVLSGTNTFSGGATLNGGTLQVGNGGTNGSIGNGNVADASSLVFDRSDAVTFAGTITGAGTLTQAGSGTLTLNGRSNAFNGTTGVQTGILIVGDDSHTDATLGGMVNVAGGTTLAGNGTIGGLDLAGTLSPGDASVGTLHVTGDAIFASGSTFAIDATPTGQSDQLAVGGTVTISGGTVMSLEQTGNWAPLTTYTIVTGAGGVSGQFASASTTLAFLTPVLSYPTDEVQLTLERNDINFNAVAQTPNQKGAATGVNGLGFGNAVYDALVMLGAPTAQVAFDQLSGEYDASQETARIEDSRYVREAMNQRLILSDADPEAAKLGAAQLTAWAHAWGHWGTTDSDGNAAKLSDNGDGLLIGADLPVGTQGRVGVTGGASHESLSAGARNSWGKLTSQWLGAFGSFDSGIFALRGGIAVAWDQIPTNREVSFPGYTDRLSGNAFGSTLTGYAEGAWTFQLGQTAISPFLNVAHTRAKTDASTEDGGAAVLHADEGSANVTLSTLGTRSTWQIANRLDLHGELGWQHAFRDVTPDRTMQFVDGGPAFTEYGVPIAQNAGLARIGLDWHVSKDVSVDAHYEGLWGGGTTDNAAKLSFNVAL